jgi:hypothetical protein
MVGFKDTPNLEGINLMFLQEKANYQTWQRSEKKHITEENVAHLQCMPL